MLSCGWVWGRLPLAGLLLAGCAFDPGGSSTSGSASDAAPGAPDARPGADSAPGATDAAPLPPDAAPVEPVLLETLTIQATGEIARSTVVLEAGASYRLVASGVVDIKDGDYSSDADYWWGNGTPWLVGNSSGGVDIGLAIDDTTIDDNRSPDWGDYAGSHVYETTMAGTGATLTAQFHDPNYGNNSGSMTLEIWGPP